MLATILLGVVAALSLIFFVSSTNDLVWPIAVGSLIVTIFFLLILHLFQVRILKEKELEISLLSKEFLLNKTKPIRVAGHDLKNYIFSISGLSRLILDSKSQAEIAGNEDLKMVQELCRQSDELMSFVEDWLDTNQNEDGEFNLGKKQVCNIIDLVKRMIIFNQNFAMENRISLEFDNKTKHKTINVECDACRVKQILNKIIRNAVKYSNQNSIVILQISLAKDGEEVCISVVDQGVGVSESEVKMILTGDGKKISNGGLKKIFDSYDFSMPIIKKLVELHQGRLEINSNKGFGTEVRIYFTTSNQSEKEAEEEMYSPNSLRDKFKNKSVLIAEDNSITNKVITFLLRKMGFYVKHVESGEEILEQLDKQYFDLIILDINMPKLGGFETAKAIREGKNFKRFKNYSIPIIAISTEKQELSSLKLYGINMLLGKPFSEKELLDFVMGCVDE